MSRPPRAREAVLDAYQRILVERGADAASMDAVAKEAGVSKGGLLYHFPTKADQDAALYARLAELVDEDVEKMVSAPEGPTAYYLRTSAVSNTPLDAAIIATGRLAQAGRAEASVALDDIRDRWADAIRPTVPDETTLELIMLIGDGIYFNNALGAGMLTKPTPADKLDAVVNLALRLVTNQPE